MMIVMYIIAAEIYVLSVWRLLLLSHVLLLLLLYLSSLSQIAVELVQHGGGRGGLSDLCHMLG